MHLFCLDVGGSKIRAGLFDSDGGALARVEGPGGALSLGAADSEAAIRAIWRDLAQAWEPGTVAMADTALFAGIAGLGLPGRGDALRARLDDFASVGLVSDGYGALVAETAGGPGALISVGTGVIGLRLFADGRMLTLGGWGFPAGDAGSGAWLGLLATGGLLAHLDGRVSKPEMGRELAVSLMDIIGSTATQIMGWQLGARPKDFARLVPLLVAGANKSDQYCQYLIEKAAKEIVVLARALGDHREGAIALGGGLGPILLPACVRLEPAISWRPAKADPVDGLVLIATGKAGGEIRLPRPGFAGS